MSQARARLATAITYAPLVREPLLFAARELGGRRTPALSRPRGSDVRVFVRHNYRTRDWDSHDQFPLGEIFRHGIYRPPPEVDSALRRGPGPPRVVDVGGHL